MKRLVVIGIVLWFCGAVVSAQVFPGEEMLDIVRVSDGSVLRGRITGQVEDEYLKIEIYGGTVFTVSYANIVSISEQRNPDYGTEWITIDIGDLSRPGDDGAPVGGDQYLGQGSILGISVGFSITRFGGSGWDQVLEDVNAESVYGDTMPAGGVSWTVMRQPWRGTSPWWMMGARTGVGFAERTNEVSIDDPSGGEGRGAYRFVARILELPVEFLVGGGGNRLIVYVGGGAGASVLLGEPESEYNGDGIEHPSGVSMKNPIQALARLSTGVYVRIGRNWIADLRLTYDKLVTDSWYPGFSQDYQAFGGAVGVGYHFR